MHSVPLTGGLDVLLVLAAVTSVLAPAFSRRTAPNEPYRLEKRVLLAVAQGGLLVAGIILVLLAAAGSGGVIPDARIARAYQLLLAREPREAERKALRGSYQHYLERFQGDPAAALELLSEGESPRDASLDPAEHAAATTVASLILNLDETVTKQ